jgi:hypothetical protein
MKDLSGPEKAATAREARDAVASRPVTSGSNGMEAALRRYLGAETYREKQLEDHEDPEHSSRG